MELMNRIMEKVGVDKALHFLAGFAIACCFALILVDKCGETAVQGAVCGVIVATMAGFVKELLDETFDWKDLLATVLGTLAVLVGAAVC